MLIIFIICRLFIYVLKREALALDDLVCLLSLCCDAFSANALYLAQTPLECAFHSPYNNRLGIGDANGFSEHLM